MTPSAFRAMLKASGLTQREFADLSGVRFTAVNRWCSLTAADRLPPPNWAIMLLIAWMTLSKKQRKDVVSQIDNLKSTADLLRPSAIIIQSSLSNVRAKADVIGR